MIKIWSFSPSSLPLPSFISFPPIILRAFLEGKGGWGWGYSSFSEELFFFGDFCGGPYGVSFSQSGLSFLSLSTFQSYLEVGGILLYRDHNFDGSDSFSYGLFTGILSVAGGASMPASLNFVLRHSRRIVSLYEFKGV